MQFQKALGALLILGSVFATNAIAATSVVYDFSDAPITNELNTVSSETIRDYVLSKGFYADGPASHDRLNGDRVVLSGSSAKGVSVQLTESASKRQLRPFGFTTAANADDESLLATAGDASRISIEWGVDIFPAEWRAGKDIRHAVQVVVEFKARPERIGSGSVFAKRADNSLGFSLCEHSANYKQGANPTSWFWTGKIYKKQTRYTCVDSPPPGLLVTSVIDLAEAYEAAFGTPWPAAGMGIRSISILFYNLGVGETKGFIRKISID